MSTTDDRPPSESNSDATDAEALRSEIDAVRHDVERTDRHLQGVIDQYEAVITEMAWEYEQRLSDLEARRDACDCPVHRLVRWLPGVPT